MIKQSQFNRPGLVLQAKCNNLDCQAHGKFVRINKGFGHFNIGRQIYECLCPFCRHETDEAENFGFCQCQWILQGKLTSERKKRVFQNVRRQNIYKRFLKREQNQALEDWNYIQITAQSVDKRNKQLSS